MKFLVWTSVLVFLLSFPVGRIYGLTDDSLWQQWKSKYGRQYGIGEEPRRRQIWEETVREIAQHNLKHDLGLVTYTQGLNQFSDMDWEELKSTYLTNDLDKQLDELRANEQIESNDDSLISTNIPDQVDWRSTLVTPVEKGFKGSSGAFSTAGVVEGQYKKKTGNLVAFSKQELLDCSPCNARKTQCASVYVVKKGLATARDYPYIGRIGRCKNSKTNRTIKGQRVHLITRNSEQKLTEGIAEVGPISVTIQAIPEFFRYKSGVFTTNRCRCCPNHAMLAVGYGKEADGSDFYIIKNNWGTDWGEQGYVRFARNKNNMCFIATYGIYISLA